MLVLTRKKGQSLFFNDQEMKMIAARSADTVVEINGQKKKVGHYGSSLEAFGCKIFASPNPRNIYQTAFRIDAPDDVVIKRGEIYGK